MNLCTVCYRDFTSVSAFDRHRVGSYALKSRRCMTSQEMSEQGLEQKPSGKWGFVANPALLAWTSKIELERSSNTLVQAN